MTKTILVDPSRCLQCGDCMIACHDEHFDNDWSPIAAPQGNSAAWIRIDQEEVASGRLVKVNRVPVLCQHCGEASCIDACSMGAIYRREDGIVIIDPKKCTGCGDCVAACAYGAIYSNDAAGICQKCTMCAHLLDAGWERPRCVTACPADALQFVDTDDLTPANLYSPLKALKPELDDEPLVKYVNTPAPFVGGDVTCAKTGDLLQNVKVTFTHQVSGATAFDYTDGFGGFKIAQLEPGFYTVAFEAPGHAFKRVRNLDLRKAVNMGVVDLTPLR